MVLQERILEKICEQIADVHVRQVVEQVLEVPKNLKPRPETYRVHWSRFRMILCLRRQGQLVEVLETVSETESSSGLWSRSVDAPVPQAVE